ncbi:chemotaxis protein CheA [Desulfurispira natronophila]|uniref:Chemotaxis protein CheA n=1 Tax=Desulfurispira natronophila TaxID=682562 RepID=A0A7W7Y2F8_9BACT|nr:chemotaxis protein CheA [Desulfurispira natronophila]MBB5020828.1 two-component system chemotaxis sensor kinase CheA [Desulfurispira natronophila]
MSRERLRQIFVEEASEIIEKFDMDVISLEDDPEDREVLNELFRGVHTLKGSANSIGFSRLGKFVHSFEDALDYFRSGAAVVDTAVIDIFLEAVDVIKEVFDDEVAQREELTSPERFDRCLESIKTLLRTVADSPTHEEEDPEPVALQEVPTNETQERPSQQAYREVLRDLSAEFDDIEQTELETADSPVNSSSQSADKNNNNSGLPDALNMAELKKQCPAGTLLYHVRMTLDDDIYIRGYDHSTFLHLLSELGKILGVHWDLSNIGLLDTLDPLRCDIGAVDVVIASDHSQDEIAEVFEFLDDFEYQVFPLGTPEHLSSTEASETSPESNDDVNNTPVDIAADPQDQTEAEATTLKPGDVTNETPSEPLDQQPQAVNNETTPAANTTATKPDDTAKPSAPSKEPVKQTVQKRSFVRIDTEKLDELFDSVGELVIAQSFLNQNEIIANIPDENVKKTLETLSKITRLIQNRVMSLRMVPIRDTFEKMRRVVRDASRKIDKDIQLQISGEDTEIDKNMVDALGDPLIHLIRNSIDHGIESDTSERTSNGKPSQGNIYLRAFHKGGSVVIEIADDGRGISRDKVLSKAIDRGLVSPDEELSDHQVYALIMQAGFSTADAISDLSGRGVGLDVVRTAIEQLRGKVEIHSEPGKGSTFSLYLPLTLAIIDGMLVRSCNETFIIPTLSILESFQPDKQSVYTYQGKGEFVKLREDILPIVRLDQMLGLDQEPVPAHEATLVCVENDNGQFALLVDELVGRQQVVIKPIGEGSIRIPQVSGAAVMGNGMVALILNVEGLY